MLAINPKIKQKAEDIRKKIFGSEVRESLASGIEAISEDVEETIGRQDYVEEQFQNVIDETTDKDVISAPELIAARNGKSNLKTRLDDEHAQVTAQLQQTEDELEYNRRVPRLMISQVASRGSSKNTHGNTTDFVVFKDVYNVYDNTFKTSGATYGLEEHKQNSTKQGVFKSLDGGDTWSKMGDLTVDTANGIWFNQIFVEPREETIYVVKTYSGHSFDVNEIVSYDNTLTQLGARGISQKRWLSSFQTIDSIHSPDYSKNIVMFGEYGTSPNSDVFRIFKTEDRGATWTIAKTFTGDWGTSGAGEIRHIHVVQADPYTGDWWVGTGDRNRQCKILRSQDQGATWEVLFEGSQRERTCNFLFEEDCIYYGMDSTNNTHPEDIKIVKINRSDLSREDVATVHNGYAVYSLTKIMYPEGFLVWSCYEGVGVSVESDEIVVQFYDYLTEKIYPVAHFNTKGLTGYKGFQAASRHQERLSGNIFAMPTPNMQQGKYGYTTVSSYIKANLTT